MYVYFMIVVPEQVSGHSRRSDRITQPGDPVDVQKPDEVLKSGQQYLDVPLTIPAQRIPVRCLKIDLEFRHAQTTPERFNRLPKPVQRIDKNDRTRLTANRDYTTGSRAVEKL